MPEAVDYQDRHTITQSTEGKKTGKRREEEGNNYTVHGPSLAREPC